MAHENPAPPRTFFDVLDEIAVAHPRIMLRNTTDPRVVPMRVERIRAFAHISIDDPNFPETSDILSRLLLAERWLWGYDDLGFVEIMRWNAETGDVKLVMKELEEGLPVGRPNLGAAKKEGQLEKARTDSFMRIMANATGDKLPDVKRAFKQAGIGTYAEFLAKIEARGREIMAATGGPLNPSNGMASFEMMTTILQIEPIELVEKLKELGFPNLEYISAYVLEEGGSAVAKKAPPGKAAYESTRPVTQRLYTALLMDQWPDSPAAIADFFLDDQKHYEALYYPVRASEITIEQLDRILGDPEAITRLVNASPSNPHKGIIFGWQATMNGLIEGNYS